VGGSQEPGRGQAAPTPSMPGEASSPTELSSIENEGSRVRDASDELVVRGDSVLARAAAL
jgi:hypothetical protein